MSRHGRTGKGVLIHCLTDGAGMPLSLCTTPANGDERAQSSRCGCAPHPHRPWGRPRKRFTVLATDKGYAAQDLRHRLRTRGIRPQIPTRVWKARKPRGRPIKKDVPRFQAERTCGWCQSKYRRLAVRWERLAACFTAFSYHGRHVYVGPKVYCGIDSSRLIPQGSPPPGMVSPFNTHWDSEVNTP